ncbi:MAG: hypothetical protein HC911_15105, partial [Chloroflexaceae bacterium]|nr:hypothetical protein [Chloroflexaceae bacterium]
MSDNPSGNTYNQQGQNVGRDQYNAGRDINIHQPAPTAAPIAIPAPVGDFAGREQELDDLAAALAT